MSLEYHKDLPNLSKGIGALEFDSDLTPSKIRSLNWKISDENVSLPAACLVEPHILHNLNWMSEFTKITNTLLCPHVKTSMCPQLMSLQMKTGSWGLSTATVQQTSILHHFGFKRNLMANPIVGKLNMGIIANVLASDPEFEFYCLVDSVTNIEELANFLSPLKIKLNVLVEIGLQSKGRGGVRNMEELIEILEEIHKTNGIIKLCGVEFYEGSLSTKDEVIELCAMAFNAAKIMKNYFITSKKIDSFIISGAGSSWFDVVTQELTKHKKILEKSGTYSEVLIILRPGCYIVHDGGIYQEAEERRMRSCSISKSLGKFKTGLHLAAYVTSCPEPTLAILGLGKRDVAIDSGFPVPHLIWRKRAKDEAHNAIWEKCPAEWRVVKTMDQHSFLTINSESDDVKVGDILILNISHPCNTFRAWRHLLLVDEQYAVKDIFTSFF